MWNYPDMSLYKIIILTAIKTDTTRTPKSLHRGKSSHWRFTVNFTKKSIKVVRAAPTDLKKSAKTFELARSKLLRSKGVEMTIPSSELIRVGRGQGPE
jgi:hypothetical protein